MNMRNSGYRTGLRALSGILCAATMGLPMTGWAQESVAVRAALISEAVPDDPTASAWNAIAPSEFPLSPQVHWPTRILQVTVQSVKARAIHNGKDVAIMLEYADPTEDPDDAAAVEFMVGEKKAHFAHGQPMAQVEGGPVNIWFWKNKDGKAVDMTAKGFGTLKAQDDQDVKAKGAYANGGWKVVFTRPVTTANIETDTQFKSGDFVNIAFAVWDGKKEAGGDLKEKGSQKAISSWGYFRLDPPPDYTPYGYAALAVALAAGFQFVVIRKLKKGSSA